VLGRQNARLAAGKKHDRGRFQSLELFGI